MEAWRNNHESEKRAQLARSGSHEVAEKTQDRGGLIERVQNGASIHLADRMETKFKRRDDSEVATATANGPEHIGVAGGIHHAELAVRGDDLG
jgi:hypothetical protein